MIKTYLLVPGALAAALIATPLLAQNNDQAGAVNQSVPPPVSQSQTLPPLQLNDDQRNKIKAALKEVHTEVGFALKDTKKDKDFEPKVGNKVPSALKSHTLPPPILSEIPVLKRYGYLKLKNEIVIVNPLTHTVADVFPES